ncbi:hypothetical protein CLV78_107174 [Aliiruegeria haliotis]|uniref:Uncharacterized protein n=1 Tax=Aliiruegeria haliotis TaxID=1280846 RepID=A0A2T0RM95_9RHOB|nr:hypothetical protein CLV78_107174 [Aliiruegeria haliotis]
MSDCCGSCSHSVDNKFGNEACPFSLRYWHFLDRHRACIAPNPRKGNMYQTWDRMGSARRAGVLRGANLFRERRPAGEAV